MRRKRKLSDHTEIENSNIRNINPNVKPVIMSYEEHAACSNWISDYHVGFKGYNLQKDDRLVTDLGKDYSTVCFLLKGNAIIYYNNREYEIMENTMFLVPTSISCEIVALSKAFLLVNNFNKPVGHIIDTCERINLENIKSTFNKDHELYNPTMPIRPVMRSFLLLLTKMIEDGVYCKHFHNEEFNKFFFLLRFYYTPEEIGAMFSPILGENMDFKHMVLKYYPHMGSIKELASACGYSMATFNRMFSETFHDTPYKWIQKKRLQVVINRLHEKNTNIAQIAQELGFSSPGHLTVFCKEFLHLTPSQFRKQHKQYEAEAKEIGKLREKQMAAMTEE